MLSAVCRLVVNYVTGPLDQGAANFIGYNAFDYYFFADVFKGMVEADRAILSQVNNLEDMEEQRGEATSNETLSELEDYAWPASFMAAPVYDSLTPNASLVGAVTAEIPWHSYIQNLIPEGINGIIVVVQNTCGQVFTYQVNGPDVLYLGPEDLHDPAYDEYEIESHFTAFNSVEDCTYSFYVYPSRELEAAYETKRPVTFTIAVVVIFLEVIAVFVVYDWLVERRQKKVMDSAIRTNAVVNSLFPATVRDRLMENAVRDQIGYDKKRQKQIGAALLPRSVDSRLPTNVSPTHGAPSKFLMTQTPQMNASGHRSDVDPTKVATNVQVYESKPIADLFPNASVLFGDIVGKC